LSRRQPTSHERGTLYALCFSDGGAETSFNDDGLPAWLAIVERT
jgi:hypothetical protein